jgi:hypothetical protein
MEHATDIALQNVESSPTRMLLLEKPNSPPPTSTPMKQVSISIVRHLSTIGIRPLQGALRQTIFGHSEFLTIETDRITGAPKDVVYPQDRLLRRMPDEPT